jgi:hypothetical protein
VIVTRKETDEPLRDALHIWEEQAPIATTTTASEHIELLDCPDIETLSTFAGPMRVVRGRVTKQRSCSQTPSTWCLLAIVAPARRLTASALLQVVRARWHIENTAFHQWTTCWCFNHVFVHDARGIQALYWLFFAAFNLLALFLYCRLRSYGRDRGKDVTRTISRLVDEMRDDPGALSLPDPTTRSESTPEPLAKGRADAPATRPAHQCPAGRRGSHNTQRDSGHKKVQAPCPLIPQHHAPASYPSPTLRVMRNS